ncbi:MAG: hypothetical protein WC169_12485 [Dehalococcoidia bacterium]|jgi:hypothetical protein
MIKKLIILILATILWIWSVLPIDWYGYIGKQVRIQTLSGDYYSGKVIDVMNIRRCIQQDFKGNCIISEDDYYLVALAKGRKDIFRCKNINKIEIQ